MSSSPNAGDGLFTQNVSSPSPSNVYPPVRSEHADVREENGKREEPAREARVGMSLRIEPAASPSPSQKMAIGVLLSGSGTNLQAILDASLAGAPYEVVLVVSSRPDAYGITRAQEAGVPTLVLNRSVYADPAEADARIAQALAKAGAQYVAMAGYMRRVTPVLLDAYPDRIINLHPALLPSFKGAHAIADAWDAGVKVTGITVHFANEDYDKGPIIAQRAVPVLEGDTLDSLEARIHAAEHELYPAVLAAVAQGRVAIDENRKVHVYE